MLPELWTTSPYLAVDCPACAADCTSRSYGNTLVWYYSPPGHNHDDNCRWYAFTCVCGLKFQVNPVLRCKRCDWRGKEDCGVCGKGILVKDRPELNNIRSTPPGEKHVTADGLVYYTFKTAASPILDAEGEPARFTLRYVDLEGNDLKRG